jgi:NTE family protein
MAGKAQFQTHAEGPDRPSPTIAVAFGSGGARGLAHINVVEALDELGLRPVVIAGSSSGAIIGAAMAAGMSGAEIRDHALETLGRRTEFWRRLWRLRPERVRDVVRSGSRIGQLDIERVLEEFLPPRIPRRFEQLAIPARIMATDYYAQLEVVCDCGDLRNALACSAAMPGLFHPVRRGGRLMVDGGISDPVPFDHLFGLVDIIVGVDVVGIPDGPSSRIPGRVESVFAATQLMMQQVIALKRERPPDIMLHPDVGRFGVFDFREVAAILERSAGIKDELKRALDRQFSKHRAARSDVLPCGGDVGEADRGG